MRIRLLIIALFSCVLTFAIPALRRWITITQSDGTKVEVMPMGDENYHYFIMRDSQKVTLASNGMLQKVTATAEAKSLSAAATRASESNTRRLAKVQRANSNNTYTGKKKGLILLVEFADKKFSMSNPKATYTAFANKEGYTNEYGAVGSVHDYFSSQSYNKFDLTFDVIGPIQVSQNYSYYGTNNSSGDDKYAARMVVEACKAALDSVTISDYDWDGDNIVDQVYVLYAGEGEATGGAANTIWPHEYTLYSAAYYDNSGDFLGMLGRTTSSSFGRGGRGGTSSSSTAIYEYGVQQGDYIFNTYACGNELFNGKAYGLSSTFMMGIGVVCHEFSHCLGFPDLYDTKGSNYGMGYFDVMCSGSYNGANALGEVPAGYSSYERAYVGWTSLQTLSDNQTVKNMQPLSDESEAYKLVNPGEENEYFLLENRQQKGWDAYIPSAGLMVTHVDYNEKIWEYNLVNTVDSTTYASSGVTNKHQRMTILHADNSDKIRYYSNVISSDEQTDLYPYLKSGTNAVNNDSITDNSAPAFALYNANTDGTYLLHDRIMNIKQNADGTVSFNYNPTATSAISDVDVTADDEIISIYDLNGRCISTSNDTSTLHSGIYILRMKSGTTKKIAVR